MASLPSDFAEGKKPHSAVKNKKKKFLRAPDSSSGGNFLRAISPRLSIRRNRKRSKSRDKRGNNQQQQQQQLSPPSTASSSQRSNANNNLLFHFEEVVDGEENHPRIALDLVNHEQERNSVQSHSAERPRSKSTSDAFAVR